MTFFRQFQHLLPNARAWSITAAKRLREFFEGLSGIGSDAKEFIDLVWLDIFPQTTRDLDAWDSQFNLPSADLTTQERRDRLDATWKALGGQSPRYLQDSIQAAGFDLYVHEWWVPGSEAAVGVKACATPRDPRVYIDNGAGYLLVNKIFSTDSQVIVRCGEPLSACGEPTALAGNFLTLQDSERGYEVPEDTTKWPYFLYVAGETFPTPGSISSARKEEFDALILKLRPAQQWVLVITEFVEILEESTIDFSTATYRSLDFVYEADVTIDFSAATYRSLNFEYEDDATIDFSTATYGSGST